MKVFVTGGTGYIGRTLVNRLLKDGHKVTILTRDKNKIDDSVRDEINILELDICDSVALKSSPPILEELDVIFHLAALLDYYGDKRNLFKVNVDGTVNLLGWTLRNRIKKFIFISSIEAVGPVEKDSIPADEDSVCNPASTYGESKLYAEMQVKKIAEEKGLNSAILRLGNVYGLGSPSFIIPIANSILKKDALYKYLPIYKDRYLHMVYIEDVVDGIMKAAWKKDISGTYILAGERYVTIGELFRLVAQPLDMDIDSQLEKKFLGGALYLNLRKKIQRLFKKADLLTYFVAGEGKRIHRAYSIEKAKKELDYNPQVDLKDGIKKTIEWAKEKGILVI